MAIPEMGWLDQLTAVRITLRPVWVSFRITGSVIPTYTVGQGSTDFGRLVNGARAEGNGRCFANTSGLVGILWDMKQLAGKSKLSITNIQPGAEPEVINTWRVKMFRRDKNAVFTPFSLNGFEPAAPLLAETTFQVASVGREAGVFLAPNFIRGVSGQTL